MLRAIFLERGCIFSRVYFNELNCGNEHLLVGWAIHRDLFDLIHQFMPLVASGHREKIPRKATTPGLGVVKYPTCKIENKHQHAKQISFALA